MASSVREIDFEEQLKEARNLLLSPPSETNELIALLDKLESLLSNVEQAPSEPVRCALLPPLKALIALEAPRYNSENFSVHDSQMIVFFLLILRLDHPTDIYTAMEKTMTLVIDESEDVSWDLLSTLLSSVRKENQDVSSTSLKLGEEVITNCDAKLKPYLLEAVQSKGIVLKEYADVVSNICKMGDGTLQHSHCNGTGEHMLTKEPDSTSPGDFCHDVDGISKSMMNIELS
ncbi:hypothetical protein Dsin_028204 [Dipteronia sinensis]|uniref:Uncharacterized protein n=1 Tax=Dipteronia sinensis TaxID=43782 RepID=A0AAD9ZQ82_9ROSI|nr:hypothetical protein Dsin_028204 [Dipteronia sinensis]